MRRLALFDLDGTITRKDSFLEFIRFCHGSAFFYLGFLLLSPAVILHKLGIISNTRLKELALGLFFKGRSRQWMNQKGIQFCQEVFPSLVKPEMQAKLENYRQEGVEIWIVTASLRCWTEPWCKEQQLQLLCSEGQYFNEMFNGTLDGPNCYGQEKVNRIKAAIPLDQYAEIIGYGDTPADKPMLALCTEAHYLG